MKISETFIQKQLFLHFVFFLFYLRDHYLLKTYFGLLMTSSFLLLRTVIHQNETVTKKACLQLM